MRITGLLLPMLLPLTLGAQDRYGTVVTEVGIEGAPPEQLDAVPIAPGQTLTVEAVRRSIQALYDDGGYGRIEVAATDGPGGGTRLVFRVEEPYFFSTVRMTPRNLFERSLSSYVDLPHGERLSRNALDDIVSALEEQLRAEGYFEFEIHPSWDLDGVTRLATVTLAVEPGPRARVRTVRFEGGEQTLSEEQLRDALNISPGSVFRLERLQDGAERIRDEFSELGFLNTRVEWDDPAGSYAASADLIDLVLRITPGPFALVQVEGYEVSEEERRDLVPIYEEGAVDDDLIEEGRVNILERVRRDGYFQAEVRTGPVTRFEDEQGNAFFQINFIVDARDRFSVAEVRIEGNSYFTDEVLRAEIGISPRGVFSRGVVSPELVDEAADAIRGMYVGEGFFDTEVTPVETVDVERGTISVVLEIEEGRRLEIGSVSYDGNTIVDDEELARIGNVYAGQVFNPGAVQSARSAMTARYHAEGYPEVRVRVQVTREESGDRVAVTYSIMEGPEYRIGRVFVAGNTLTKEKVIRRNSETLREDTPYDPQAILAAQRSLYATGLFNQVDIVPLQHDRNGYRDILIQVEDAGPLLLTYGVGYQLVDPLHQQREGFRGTVEISHTNLWGLDRSISFRLRGSRSEQRFQATYREPRLFNWDLDGFASLFIERARRLAFDADRIDFSIQTLKQFLDTESFLLSASYQTVNLKEITLLNERLEEEEGIIQIARVGTSYIHDSRRRDGALDPINPNTGNYFTGTFQVAEDGFGSEVNFTSFYGQASIYRRAKQSVLAASARLGWNRPYGDTVALPISERYFAGGSTTLRAFRQDEAGPPAGGNALVLLNAEYRYPIPFLFSGLGGVLFYDTGTVFPRLSDFNVGDFTHTAGLGLRYDTPLGPIRVDLGFNLNRQPDNERERHDQLHFTLGHAF